MTTARYRILGLLTGMALATTGCSHWIELPQSTGDADLAPISVIAQDRVPLIIEAVRSTQNGAALGTSGEIERHVLSAFENSRLFSEYFQSGYAQPMADRPYVKARLSMENTVEPHAGDAALKGIVVGASMFLLAPVIELQYGYGSQMTLEIERWDGQVKRYVTSSAGTARYNLFGASPQVIEELKGQVTDRCLTALLHQVVQDTSFYLASSTPSFKSPIHSVSVTNRRGELRPIPVSTPSEPSQP
jgi:hypothetical protein